MATRFLGKNYVILMNEVLKLAYSEGIEVVKFIIAHELGHIKNKHFLKNKIIFPSRILFLTYRAFRRACELTCDNYGKMLSPEGAEKGIIALAVVKNLYKRVNVTVALKHGIVDQGFWGWLAEKMSTHPSLQKRLQNLK